MSNEEPPDFENMRERMKDLRRRKSGDSGELPAASEGESTPSESNGPLEVTYLEVDPSTVPDALDLDGAEEVKIVATKSSVRSGILKSKVGRTIASAILMFLLAYLTGKPTVDLSDEAAVRKYLTTHYFENRETKNGVRMVFALTFEQGDDYHLTITMDGSPVSAPGTYNIGGMRDKEREIDLGGGQGKATIDKSGHIWLRSNGDLLMFSPKDLR